MQLGGLMIGVSTFLIIGLLHPVVIKAQYHFGKKVWFVFLLGGIISLITSLFVKNVVLSAILGSLGFSLLWSIHEIIEQELRVARGWYPSKQRIKISDDLVNK